MDTFIKDKIIELVKEQEKRQIFEVDMKLAKPIISLWLIQTDIEQIIDTVKKVVTLSKLDKIKVDEIVISGLWQKTIVTYGKLFTKSEDGFSTLEQSEYIKTIEDKNLHDKLMDIRHSYIAHRGLSDFENCLLLAILDKTEENCSFEYTFPSANRIGNYLKDDEIQIMLNFLNRLHKMVYDKLQAKISKLDKKIWGIILKK